MDVAEMGSEMSVQSNEGEEKKIKESLNNTKIKTKENEVKEGIWTVARRREKLSHLLRRSISIDVLTFLRK